ncbi:MAG TPA: MFS transporter, partial [Trebonia sp.]|nr:MFS transporter [Trebonia sp.]
SRVLLVVGAVLAGMGHGAAYLAAQDDLTRIAPDDQRAEVSAAFNVCIYLGVALPVIGIGILADLTTLFTAVTTFAAVTGAGALAVAAWHLRHRDGGSPGPHHQQPGAPGGLSATWYEEGHDEHHRATRYLLAFTAPVITTTREFLRRTSLRLSALTGPSG